MQWQDFDLEGRVKVPLGYYLILFYLARGYLTWIVSLTYRENPSLLLSMAYPDARFFSLSLLLGLPALVSFILFSLKSQVQKSWFKKLWRYQYSLLLVAVAIDFLLQVLFIVGQAQLHWFMPFLLILGIYLIWYWLRSKKVKRFFNNWLLTEK